MESPSSAGSATARLVLLTLILFISYLCVAMSLPVVPLFVARELGLGNVWAGAAVGVVFLATIATRPGAGTLCDRAGAKRAVARGLVCYVAGALVCLPAGLLAASPAWAFAVLAGGRLLIGLGESQVGVGVVAWGIGMVGPAQAGRVLALVGAALYGAFAAGGPIGLALFGRLGFAGTMAVNAALPALGLLAIGLLPGVAPHPQEQRPSFWRVMARIWPYGGIVCLQGIGFAAIGTFLSLLFLHRHWPLAGFGLTAFGVGFVLVRLLGGHLPDRLGGLAVATASLAVEALGQALIWLAWNPTLALSGAFLSGLGCSLIFPGMGREVVQRVEPQVRGVALAGFAAFQDLAYGLTGPLAGLLADRAGYASIFLAGAVAAALGLAMSLVLRTAR